jgi:hypothetical protein
MKIKILNKVWELIFCPNLKNRGNCDSPCSRNKKITIWKGLKGEEELEILIHEMLHAAFWQIDEHYIAEASKDIAKVLWKLGYKK